MFIRLKISRTADDGQPRPKNILLYRGLVHHRILNVNNLHIEKQENRKGFIKSIREEPGMQLFKLRFYLIYANSPFNTPGSSLIPNISRVKKQSRFINYLYCIERGEYRNRVSILDWILFSCTPRRGYTELAYSVLIVEPDFILL